MADIGKRVRIYNRDKNVTRIGGVDRLSFFSFIENYLSIGQIPFDTSVVLPSEEFGTNQEGMACASIYQNKSSFDELFHVF